MSRVNRCIMLMGLLLNKAKEKTKQTNKTITLEITESKLIGPFKIDLPQQIYFLRTMLAYRCRVG